MKLLVLYRSSVSETDQMAAATPEQAKAGMAAGWSGRSGTAARSSSSGRPSGYSAESGCTMATIFGATRGR
jgi:hypothetical protein